MIETQWWHFDLQFQNASKVWAILRLPVATVFKWSLSLTWFTVSSLSLRSPLLVWSTSSSSCHHENHIFSEHLNPWFTLPLALRGITLYKWSFEQKFQKCCESVPTSHMFAHALWSVSLFFLKPRSSPKFKGEEIPLIVQTFAVDHKMVRIWRWFPECFWWQLFEQPADSCNRGNLGRLPKCLATVLGPCFDWSTLESDVLPWCYTVYVIICAYVFVYIFIYDIYNIHTVCLSILHIVVYVCRYIHRHLKKWNFHRTLTLKICCEFHVSLKVFFIEFCLYKTCHCWAFSFRELLLLKRWAEPKLSMFIPCHNMLKWDEMGI